MFRYLALINTPKMMFSDNSYIFASFFRMKSSSLCIANLIIENSVEITQQEVEAIVNRITGRGDLKVSLLKVSQDPILVHNQDGEMRCGDNGIFKGIPLTDEEKELSKIAHDIYASYPSDGKPYAEIVDIARKYIQGIGGFEKFAEWGLF